MPELNDRAYYAARATKALQLYEMAANPAIAAIHRRMADSYLELANPAVDQRTMLRVVGR